MDLYEFVRLFERVNYGRTSEEVGHALTLRTCECMNRVLFVLKGREGDMERPKFSRNDKFNMMSLQAGSGDKKSDGKGQLFSKSSYRGGGSSAAGGEERIFPPVRNIGEKLAAFKSTVLENPKIRMVIQRRRFTMVTKLEEGCPGPKTSNTFFDDESDPLNAAVALGWDDVVERFVRYTHEHCYSVDLENHAHGGVSAGSPGATCIMILETFTAHLVKARTWPLDAAGNKLESLGKAEQLHQCSPSWELEDDEAAAYHAKQSELSRMGVTALCARIVCVIEDSGDGSLTDVAVDLLAEMMNGGNHAVAEALYAYLVDVDTEGKFLAHLRERLQRGQQSLIVGRKRGLLGNGNEMLTPEIVADVESLIMTARLMQLCCEGHNERFQNYYREQPMYSGGSLDLLSAVNDLLVVLCETSIVVASFTGVELDLATQLLATLIECCQGPCAGNQVRLAHGDCCVALNSIMPAAAKEDAARSVSDPRHVDMRGQACVLLAALLEGRPDRKTHLQLDRRLEEAGLSAYRRKLEHGLRAMRRRATSADRLHTEEEMLRIHVLQRCLVGAVTVQTELQMGDPAKWVGGAAGSSSSSAAASGGDERDGEDEPDGDDGEASTGAGAEGGSKKRRKKKRKGVSAAEEEEEESMIGIVEVFWKGKVEVVCFPMPFQMKYLSDKTKNAFLNDVDLSTSDKRVTALLDSVDGFMNEMEMIYHKAEQSSTFRFLNKNLPPFKVGIYFVVVLLNLNVVMSPSALEKPMQALLDDFSGDLTLNGYERVSLFVTMALNLIVTLGYFLIVGHLTTVEVPMLVQDLDDAVEEKLEEVDGDANDESLKDVGAFRSLALPGIIANVVLSVMHKMNYPAAGFSFVALLPHICFFVAIQVPLSAICMRRYIVVPTTPAQRYFVIVYDCMTNLSFLRQHLFLAAFSVLGLWDVEFLTLELLDVINISPVIADIIKSVTQKKTALGLVLYLFVISVVIYAAFGMAHFHEYMQPTYTYLNDDGTLTEGTKECSNLLTCSYFFFHEGLGEAGNMKSFMKYANPGSDDYPWRILFDSIFFVWGKNTCVCIISISLNVIDFVTTTVSFFFPQQQWESYFLTLS